jgi:hypothetical protein
MKNTKITKTMLVISVLFVAIHSAAADECLVVNGGFEDDPNIIFEEPDDYGYWAGNYSEVVGTSDGITPLEGSKMLHFIHAAYGDYADESMNSELWQIIDISAFAALINAGEARAWGLSSFNRVAGDPNTDTEFLIQIAAYQGDPCDFWKLDDLTAESSSIISDSNTSTWESASTSLFLPADTDFIVVKIAAVENVYNDIGGVEFEGHYGDSVCVTVGPARIYVDVNAPGPLHNGSNWETAFQHLQDALSIAEYGEEIWVAEGTYKPDSDAANPTGTGNRNATFQLVSGVAVYGGYPSGGGDRNIEQYQTILSGDIATIGNNSDNSYSVITGSTTDPNTVIDGFTITDGSGTGAGMYNLNGSPTVSNCNFVSNFATVGHGGGMYNETSSPTVVNCKFFGNATSGSGGGMYNLDCNSMVINCLFSGNTGDYGGGMCNSTSCNPMVINCTFSGNTAHIQGGGIYNNTGKPKPTLNNCILWNNMDSGPTDESAQISNSSSIIINYSCVLGWTGGLGGIGNIGNDPYFAGADGPDGIIGTEDDNLRLLADSNCIDAGDNSAVPVDTYDLDNDSNTDESIPFDLDRHARFVDEPNVDDSGSGTKPIVDMGAYERGVCGDQDHPYLPMDFNLDCIVNFIDFDLFADYWLKCTKPECQ